MAVAVLGLACAHPTRPTLTVSPLAAPESAYLGLRSLRDTIDVTSARGRDSVAGAAARYAAARQHVQQRLAATGGALPDSDRRAADVMRRALEGDLGPLDVPSAGDTAAPSCDYDPAALATPADSGARLRARMYACFGQAARRVIVGARDTLDRLTVLGMISQSDDPVRRRALFLALAPIWRSVNGDDGSASPYRTALRAIGRSAGDDSAGYLGVSPDTLTRWLTSILEAWRSVMPDTVVEPWDYFYLAGAASRRLSPRIARGDLVPITERAYRALGADLRGLDVRYDLDPRDGKTPVAYTTFGSRGHLAGGQWVRSTAWVFATYPVGGFDNLTELMHETGHAIHISAIHTRPAFEDWPDSDPLTEAIGDVVALDVYEPRWQWRLLGDSVPLAAGLRAKYASIVLDIAWALFEVRERADPAGDPNVVWTDITSRYLRIAPHPEWSWWAMRGQLVDAPGYMMNYALGAIVAADLRDGIRRRHGAFVDGDATWYGWVSDQLFQFGLARSSRDVIPAVLGRPLSPRALLDDLHRLNVTR